MLLSVKDLSISFLGDNGPVAAINQLSFYLEQGECLGIVGESGCGKSMTNLALMGLLPRNTTYRAKEMLFDGVDLKHLKSKEWRALRGNRIAMIFQDPIHSLNPLMTVQSQLLEAILRADPTLSRKAAYKVGIELLEQVGLSSPELRMKYYPHELSGGMAQRVMIAMMLAFKPSLLIADEPTTALDVTTQAQILSLLDELRREYNMSMLLVSHDIELIRGHTDRIAVMYSGEIVESGITKPVLSAPKHPYTQGLLAALPNHVAHQRKQPLTTIPGTVLPMSEKTQACRFSPRCPNAMPECQNAPVLQQRPETGNLHTLRCYL
ncbi:ABC transporter ATP-binding protein [Algicola sagamiensis]|uniref:ABC transporter ATP-binding protein n=1 Tax=Algicola sagamiensis TaxID=163869 RepID=UPI0003629E39|nr:ABC transporter ATP-binding protein [Algicola sagamiensis]